MQVRKLTNINPEIDIRIIPVRVIGIVANVEYSVLGDANPSNVQFGTLDCLIPKS